MGVREEEERLFGMVVGDEQLEPESVCLCHCLVKTTHGLLCSVCGCY